VYIHAPEEAGKWAPGGASCWWLHHALEDLLRELEARGFRLIIRKGGSEETLFRLLEETGADGVYWNRCYERYRMREDSRIKTRLKDEGHEGWSGNALLLREPWQVATGSGGPYRVFTPFSRACDKLAEPSPVENNGTPEVPPSWPESLALEDLKLLPEVPWDGGLAAAWTPTRRGGLSRLNSFLEERVGDYKEQRNFPAEDGTSALSPYLHFGQVGPREVVARIRAAGPGKGAWTYHREILWREFAYHVLYHFPETPEQPLQKKFEAFPWKRDGTVLRRWQQGLTGYPIVDAGMRQLWQTGWMHNRVRMIVASFLVKHLLHSWEDGAAWFWDTLVDADLASNTLGWQWAGGCGADAAPYFRVFNPITQGEKFDPEGRYTRKYVPELANVPDKFLYQPWEMPPSTQEACGCVIGEDYPEPVIAHREGRERALEAFATVKGGGS